MTYAPSPIDTSKVKLPDALTELNEVLAENVHDHWAQKRIEEGWVYGPQRNDSQKTHPCLVPFSALPDSEKAYDRVSAEETLKTILAMGYRITKDH